MQRKRLRYHRTKTKHRPGIVVWSSLWNMDPVVREDIVAFRKLLDSMPVVTDAPATK